MIPASACVCVWCLFVALWILLLQVLQIEEIWQYVRRYHFTSHPPGLCTSAMLGGNCQFSLVFCVCVCACVYRAIEQDKRNCWHATKNVAAAASNLSK